MNRFTTLIPTAPHFRVDWPACCQAIPALLALETCPQDPLHHAEGNVGIHTRWVLDILTQHPEYQGAYLERQERLFFAALLHDIAKPATTREEDGRLTARGHSKRGSVDARILLWEAGFAFAQREAICRLIAVHQVPFYLMNKPNPEFELHRLSHELCLAELALLAECDIRGREARDIAKTLDNVELFRELAKDAACYTEPRAMADAYTAFKYFRSEGSISPDYPFFQEPGSEVIVMCGLPASGKNTWLAKHHPGLPTVSFDDAREALGLKHGQNEGKAAHLVFDQAKEFLRKQAPFAWNATHLSLDMRNKTLDLLYRYQAKVTLVYLETDPKTLFSRNHQRDTSLSNDGIKRMLHRWEVPVPSEAPEVCYHVG